MKNKIENFVNSIKWGKITNDDELFPLSIHVGMVIESTMSTLKSILRNVKQTIRVNIINKKDRYFVNAFYYDGSFYRAFYEITKEEADRIERIAYEINLINYAN